MISCFKNASLNFFFKVGVAVGKVELLTSLLTVPDVQIVPSEGLGWEARALPLSLRFFFFLALLLHYSETSPLGHLCSRDTSIQGTKNLVLEKRPHNFCICYLY